MDAELFKKLDPYLERLVNDGITLDEDERKKFNKYLQMVLHKTLLEEMKKTSPVFKKLFRQLHYGGSFYENLRVKDPNEFDINVELVLPIKSDIKVILSVEPGFAKVNISHLEFSPNTEDQTKRCISEWFDKWFDDGFYLQRPEVLKWMQGVVDTALDSVEMPEGIKVRRRTSGPAITLVVWNTEEFSIDLVPVFVFDILDWPSPPFRQLNDVSRGRDLNKKWFVVPKSPGGFLDYPSLWRVSFYYHEKEFMNNLYHMKPVLKLIKKLRDLYNWKGLSSYYIKTIFMWEVSKQDEDFWEESLGVLLLHMLEKVQEALHERRISFFWHEEFNLINKIHEKFIEGTENCIGNIRKRIILHLKRDNPRFILDLYAGPKKIKLEDLGMNSDSESDVESDAKSDESDTESDSEETGKFSYSGSSTGTSNRIRETPKETESSFGVLGALGLGFVGAVAITAGLAIFSRNRNNRNN